VRGGPRVRRSSPCCFPSYVISCNREHSSTSTRCILNVCEKKSRTNGILFTGTKKTTVLILVYSWRHFVNVDGGLLEVGSLSEMGSLDHCCCSIGLGSSPACHKAAVRSIIRMCYQCMFCTCNVYVDGEIVLMMSSNFLCCVDHLVVEKYISISQPHVKSAVIGNSPSLPLVHDPMFKTPTHQDITI
jgi:hypothetical protein